MPVGVKKKKKKKGLFKSVQLTDLKEWLCSNLIHYESTSQSSGDECDGIYWKMNSAWLALSVHKTKRSILPRPKQTRADRRWQHGVWQRWREYRKKKLTFIQIRASQRTFDEVLTNLKPTELLELSNRSPRLTRQLICSQGNLSQER